MKKSNKIAILSEHQEEIVEIAEIIKSITSHSYQIYDFNRVDECIEFCKNRRVDLLLAHTSSLDIILQQRESLPDKNLEFILFSSSSKEVESGQNIFNIGALDLFRYPFNRDEIEFKLNRYINEYKNMVKDYNRTQKQLDRVTRISDRQQSELKDLNNELDRYKHHLEDKVEEGLLEIKALNREIEDTQKEVIFTMGAIGESRSKETGNHVKRVAEYSYLLAVKYGLSEKEAEMLKQASPMHDIGKVAIPDRILNKPARFTEDEFILMQRHTEFGFEMLKHSTRELLKTASIVAYEHHEKWNGRGYPRGLKGDEIHIYGRITAIADVFDALGSDRVYKKGWEDERIFTLFREERGEHFDPKLVDLFFENLEDILAIRDRFVDDGTE